MAHGAAQTASAAALPPLCARLLPSHVRDTSTAALRTALAATYCASTAMERSADREQPGQQHSTTARLTIASSIRRLFFSSATAEPPAAPHSISTAVLCTPNTLCTMQCTAQHVVASDWDATVRVQQSVNVSRLREPPPHTHTQPLT